MSDDNFCNSNILQFSTNTTKCRHGNSQWISKCEGKFYCFDCMQVFDVNDSILAEQKVDVSYE